jgi:hypothetical protein
MSLSVITCGLISPMPSSDTPVKKTGPIQLYFRGVGFVSAVANLLFSSMA